jgi:hypothetical protein
MRLPGVETQLRELRIQSHDGRCFREAATAAVPVSAFKMNADPVEFLRLAVALMLSLRAA